MTNGLFKPYEMYNGWQIFLYEYGTIDVYYAEKAGVQSPKFYNLADVHTWVDKQTGQTYDPNVDTVFFKPELFNWVGELTQADVARENKLVAFGPAPPGVAGQIEGLILLVGLKKLSETPEGIKVIRDLAIRYLSEMGRVITSLSLSSSANPYNCIINDYVCVRIYQRLGIISAHDAVQTAAWLDHVMGIMLQKEYFKDSLTGLTSMVTGLERAIPAILGGGK